MNRFLISASAAIGTLAMIAVGCGEPVAEKPAPADVVYFDRATKKPVVAAAADKIPAAHPVTGKRTLVPALYCRKCRKWRPAPPVELQQRDPTARDCPQHKIRMTTDGPRPE